MNLQQKHENKFKLDVVVFSRNRNSELSKSIASWGGQPYRFIILHNSEKPIRSDPLLKNIVYRHLPGLNYGQRASEAVDLLKSDFSVILSDDERLIPSGIDSMIQTLVNDPSLASIGGKVLGVYSYGSVRTGNFAYSHMDHYENKESNVLRRLTTHLGRPIYGGCSIGGIYRITRKESMKAILQLLSRCSFIQKQTPFVYEMAGEFAIAAVGPTTTINQLYWIRNWQTKIFDGPEWKREANFSSWWTNPLQVTQKEIFINELSEFASISQKETERIIDARLSLMGINQGKKQISSFEIMVKAFIRKYLSHIIPSITMPKEIRQVLSIENPDNLGEAINEITKICEELLK